MSKRMQPTSAGHELKPDVIEFLLEVPQSQDEADGNTGCSWILQQHNSDTFPVKHFVSIRNVCKCSCELELHK